MAKFSERVKAVEMSTTLIIDGIDTDIRNRIWNCVLLFYFNRYEQDMGKIEAYDNFKRYHQIKYIFEQIWLNEFVKPWDEFPDYYNIKYYYRKIIIENKWYEPYDLLESFIKYENDIKESKKFIEIINSELDKSRSGYRVVGKQLIEMTNDSEINEVDEALRGTSGIKGVQEHLDKAIHKLGDRKNPDYRNSIKESISALEALVRNISGKSKFSDAIDEIAKKVDLDTAQKEGFKKIYGYTSGENGIRHALMDKDTVQFEDAKYMLVSCSAFINYLIEKARKAGIELK